MSAWTESIVPRLRTLRFDSIRTQILGFAVLAALLPALAMTLVSSRQSRGSLTDQVARELRSVSAETAGEIDQWLTGRLSDLRVSASSYAVAENLARLQGKEGGQALRRLREYLTSARDRLADCEALLVSDARGRAVASSGGRMSGVQFSPERLSGLRTGDALVGDAYWDAGVGKAAVLLAVPIRGVDGQFLGALTAKINLRSVADILQRLAPRDPGDVYVITDQGRLVIRSRVSSADVMRTKLATTTTQPLFDKEGTSVVYKRGDGREVVGTLRRVPQLRWAVVVELPRAEAIRQVAELRIGTAWMVAALLAGVGLALGLLIVRPLERLTSAAAKLAAGDLSVELPVGGSGEVGYLTRTFGHLVGRLREREGQGELERLSVTDALTGLYNRRHLTGTLANEVQRSRRLRRTFSVLLADVDHFKQYNDTHGHLEGDAALVKIAEVLRKTTRGVDAVARYGGEEFLVMLVEAPIATGAIVAERIRARVAAEEFSGGKMTMSIGVAEYPAHGDTPEELIASADAAMYQAKSAGRDRVGVAGGKGQREREGEGEGEGEGKRRRKGDG